MLLRTLTRTKSICNVYTFIYKPSGYQIRKLSDLNQKRDFVEVRIPVPWGHIAGKWWGPQDQRPILGIHGWQDNSGSFDKLAPLLPEHIGFFAIDMVGHGLSSWYPSGIFYHQYDGVLVLRRIVEYFQWPKMSLLGHSMGSILSFLYTALYPDEVDFLVGIDMLKPISALPGGNNGKLTKVIKNFLRNDELIRNSNPPSYTLDEAIQRLVAGTRGSVSKEIAPYLLRRAMKRSENDPNKYYFTRDLRLKTGVLPGFLHDECLAYANKITPPVMNIKASNSPFFEDSKYYFEVLEELKRTSKDMHRIEVDGKHHLHLENPERIYEEINKFILKHDVESRSIGGMKPEMLVKDIEYPF